MVDPSIELILVVLIVSNQGEIVGGSGLGRLRVVIEHGKGSRIYSVLSNNIRRCERRSCGTDGGRGIVQHWLRVAVKFCEVALPF